MFDEVSQPWLVTTDEPCTGYERIKALKKELHRNVKDLLALAPTNDPFYAGSPASREKAEWFLALWEHFGFTRGVHLRRIHYRLVSVEVPYKKADGLPYENTEACWDYLGTAGKYARYLGFVDADAFEDHRNPAPHLYMEPAVDRQTIGAEADALLAQLQATPEVPVAPYSDGSQVMSVVRRALARAGYDLDLGE